MRDAKLHGPLCGERRLVYTSPSVVAACGGLFVCFPTDH